MTFTMLILAIHIENTNAMWLKGYDCEEVFRNILISSTGYTI